MTNWYLPAAAVDDDDLANDDVVLDWNYNTIGTLFTQCQHCGNSNRTLHGCNCEATSPDHDAIGCSHCNRGDL